MDTGELDSYLIEITRDILAYKDADGAPLVDKILDTAGQKARANGQCKAVRIWEFPSHSLPKRFIPGAFPR